MKPRHFAFLGLLMTVTLNVRATSLTWDTSPGTVGAGDSSITGGTGTWNTTTALGNWTADGGANNIAWVNANNDGAIFGGTAGTVTVTSVTANSLTFNTTAGYIVTGSTITLAGTTPTITANVDAKISSVLAGTLGLVKSGAGTLTLSAANTYTGGTTINAGTLNLDFSTRQSTTPVNLGAIAVGATGTLSLFNTAGSGTVEATYYNGGAITGSGIISTSGSMEMFGGSSINSFTGQINVVAGRLGTNGSDWSSTGAMNLDIASGAIFDIRTGTAGVSNLTGLGTVTTSYVNGGSLFVGNNSASSTFGGTIINGGSGVTLTKVGSGTLTLSGANTYTGGTNVNGGTLAVTGGVTGSAQLVIGATGAGAVTLSGSMNIVNGGTGVVIGSNNSTNAGFNGTFTQTGGSFTTNGNIFTGNAATTNVITLSGGTFANTAGTTYVGIFGGNNTTLNINGGAATLKALTYYGGTGTTNLTSGTLQVTTVNIGPSSPTSTFNFDGGTLKAGAATITFMQGLTNAKVKEGGAQIDTNTFDITIAKALTHGGVAAVDGGLTKSNTGKLTLTGANTYTGPTNVNQGTLAFGTGGSMSASSIITVAVGATLDETVTGWTLASGQTLQGGGSVLGNTTVSSGATLSPGIAGIGTLTGNAALTMAGNAVFEINKAGAVLTNDQVTGLTAVNYGGTLTVTASGDTLAAGDSFQLFVAGTYNSGFGTYNLPILPAGLSWDTSGLLVNGSISVVNFVGTPNFNPVGGGYVGAQSVTISSDSGSTIHYTTDGSDPTTSGTVLTGASPLSGIIVPDNSTATIMAYATKTGQGDSPVATAVYHTVTTPTWNVDADGNWSESANWLSGVIPDGSGVPADFSVFPQNGDATVTLDSNRAVGSLTFGNTNGFNWALAASGGSVLTLAGSSPTITVLDDITTISAPLAGTQGLTKSGVGTLSLIGGNSYTGGTTVSGGTLQIGNGTLNGTIGSGTYSIASGAKLLLNYATGAAPAYSNFTGAGMLELRAPNPASSFANWGTSALPVGFTGTMQLDSGRLLIGAPSTLGGATAVSIGSGGQILFYDGTTSGTGYTFAQNYSISGVGTLEAVHNLGALRVAGMNATISGNVTLTGNAGLYTQSGQPNSSLKITGVVSDAGSGFNLTANASSGTISLAGVNTYTGTTIIGAGTLEISGAGQLGSGSYSANISNAGTLLYNSTATQTLSGNISGAGAITKASASTLTLSGTNTYTGNTTVNAGTLALASSGTLTFKIGANGVNNQLTGAGTATLDGTFALDLTSANTTSGNSWTLVNVGSLTETFGASFAVSGFTQAADVWTMTSGGNTWTFTEATGILSVSQGGYNSWAASFPGLTDATPGGDPDNDGLSNLLEYVLGGDPRISDASIRPVSAIVGTDLVLTYKRSDDSKNDTTQVGQWSTNLIDWNDVNPVIVNDNGSAPDDMSVTVPMSNAVNGKLFLRLHVTQ